jgi:hypothetical protein
MIRAVPIGILRQVLLVVVGAEAIYSAEFSGLLNHGQSTGRLSVDVAVDPPVDQIGFPYHARLAANRSLGRCFDVPARAIIRKPVQTLNLATWS